MSRRLPLFTLRASVRTVLAEAGDKGATLADIEAATGADRHSIQRALGGAREKFAVPITSKLWRHFATEAQRDAGEGVRVLMDHLFVEDAAGLDRAALGVGQLVRQSLHGRGDDPCGLRADLALGQSRATMARNYLTSLGIAAERLVVISLGEERPACTQSDESCWQQNSRS